MHQTSWLPTLSLVCLLGLPVHPSSGQTQDHPVTVTSSVMTSGETMPRRYTPDGHNLSPALEWSNLPAGTQELAVVCADFGAGSPPPWTHWLIYGIPATARGLPEGLPILANTPMSPDLTGASRASMDGAVPTTAARRHPPARRTSTTLLSTPSTKFSDSHRI